MLSETAVMQKRGLTNDMLSIQDIIDMFIEYQKKTHISLQDVPLGLLVKKNTGVFILRDKHLPLLLDSIYKIPILNFSDSYILTPKSEMYINLETLKKENRELKLKLQNICSIIET